VNALGGSLSGLVLDEVTADSNIDWSQATHLRVLTADGTEFTADLAQSEEKSWIRLAAAEETQQADASGKGPEEAVSEESAKQTPVKNESADAEAAPGEPAEGETVEKSAAMERAERIASINKRVHGWAYAIPQYKSQVIQKRLADLLKPPEPEKEN
jgi:hypothetical protein